MRRTVTVGLSLLLAAAPLPGTAGNERGIASAEERSAATTPGPATGAARRPAAKIATTIALVGVGIGMVLAGGPDYVPSRFAPGNTPQRVDLSLYLGAGAYPGHTYEVTYERGDAFGTGYACPGAATRCIVGAEQLAEQYALGFADGYDLGRFNGLAAGHRQGFADARTATIRILDANGFVVYDGDFTPASYVRERFSDRKFIRYGGVGLLSAGALIGLFWPDSPARRLELRPLRGGGRVGLSFGF